MVDIRWKTYERSCIETTVHNDGILWLNKKTYRRKIRSENCAINCNKISFRSKKTNIWTSRQTNRIFIKEKLSIKVVMDCRRTLAHKFRRRFKQYYFILTKDQSVLTKTMSSFKKENIKTQYNALSYRIDLYFHEDACNINWW